MSSELRVYQGEDKTIVVTTNIDLTDATEIEFVIDTETQITKSLTLEEISGVTSSQFQVQLDAGDTETITAGEYLYQCRATISSKIVQGKFSPNKIEILESAFTSAGSGNDYN